MNAPWDPLGIKKIHAVSALPTLQQRKPLNGPTPRLAWTGADHHHTRSLASRRTSFVSVCMTKCSFRFPGHSWFSLACEGGDNSSNALTALPHPATRSVPEAYIDGRVHSTRNIYRLAGIRIATREVLQCNRGRSADVIRFSGTFDILLPSLRADAQRPQDTRSSRAKHFRGVAWAYSGHMSTRSSDSPQPLENP